MNIGIIGQGFVGNAVFQKFKSFFKVYTYDVVSEICNSSYNDLVKNCKIIFICIPTPMNKDGSCNVELVRNVLYKLNKETNAIVVNKSTVIPGSTENFNQEFENLQIVFNPEFLTERRAVEDFENQTRIILGGPRPATTRLKEIYSVVFKKVHYVKTGSKHAEMVKYITNCYLANKVSFANEMYQLAQALDLDYDKVLEYSLHDERLGTSHWAVKGPDGYCGFGGHCLPKDLNALIKVAQDNGVDPKMMIAARDKNDEVREVRDWEQMKGRAIV